jgi:multidrug resistance protein, MATE family
MAFMKTYELNAAGQRQGGIREMISIALPMVVSFACDTVMIFTDRFLLSQLGPTMMNAALGGGVSFYMLITFMFGLTGYTTALAAQYLGARLKENCSKVAAQAGILIVLAWPVIVLLRVPASELFTLMGVSEAQIMPQNIYFRILAIGSVATLLRHCLASFFSGIGNAKIVMVASLIAMLINILASYTLIFGYFGFPEMGIAGAAYGTIFASFCACLILAGVYFSKTIRTEYSVMQSFAFRWEIMKKLLRYGYPAGVEMFLAVTAFNFMVMTFHSTDPANATAASIMLNWDMMTYIPLMGIEIGVTSLVGRYMGAGRSDIAHQSTMSGVKIGLVYASLMFVMFMFFPRGLATIFEPESTSRAFDQALPSAIYMLRLICLYLMSEIVFVVFVGALRGAGDTLWAMSYSIVLHWFLAITLFVMLRGFHTSIETGWTTVIALFLVLSTVVVFRYHGGKWKLLRIVHQD